MKKLVTVLLIGLFFFSLSCSEEKINVKDLKMLEGGKTFAVPTGTAADQMVLKRFPDANLLYFTSVLDCALAVKIGKADAAVYDLPVLKNIAGKNEGLTVIEELIVPDDYGFAVAMENLELKEAIDATLSEIKSNGIYQEMMQRWFPAKGNPGPMPSLSTEGDRGTLIFGTAAVTEPMSYVEGSGTISGFDIEFATRIAMSIGKKIEIVNLEFGAMLPALIAGKVDMIGAGLSITEERAKSVLFSQPYYISGIVALVKESNGSKQEIPGTESRDTTGTEELKFNRLGVLMGSIHESFAIRLYPEATLLSYNSTSDMLLGLSNQKVEGAFVDHISVKEIQKANPNFIVLQQDLFVVDIAAAFNKQNDQLLNDYNRFLAEIRANSVYNDMVRRWMEEENYELPDLKMGDSPETITVGTSTDIGFPFTAKYENEYTGFEIELAIRFSQFIGKKVTWVDMPFGSLLPSLVSNKIDIIMSSLMITEERQKQVNFSTPYYASGASILGNKSESPIPAKNNPDGISNVTDGPSFFEKVSDSFHNNIIKEGRYKLIFKGLWITILISILSAIVGTMLGGVICWMRMSKNKFLLHTASIYIALVRGTPVLVLLMIIYYIIFASVNIDPVLVAVVAFGINFAAYVSEMFRTGIESVDKGQHEAGIASGFTRFQTFYHIIMPQALRQVLPVYKGEFVSLVKMTSIVGYIAVEDLTKASDIIRSRTFDAFFPLIMAAIIYIIISWSLTLFLDYLEISIDPRKRSISLKKEVAQ
jgi:polar amino acid transport system substrate-binding protein